MCRLCLICHQPLSEELTWQELFSFKLLDKSLICTNCQSAFIKYQMSGNCCQGCHRSLDPNSQMVFKKIYEWKKEIFCLDCFRWLSERAVDRLLLDHSAIYEYNEFLSSFLYRYKYLGDYRLAKVPSIDLREVYEDYRDYQWLILPSSPQSMNKRLFHPTAGFLQEAGIPFISPFTYVGDGVRQASKNRFERMRMKQPFYLSHLNLEKYKGQNNYLIFDDVYTTGATLIQAKQELIRVLVSSGIKDWQVISLSLGRDNLKQSEDSAFKKDASML